MHKKAEDNLLDNFNAEAVQSANRMLRKVDTDELDFDAFCDELAERLCNSKKRKTMASKGSTEEHVQTTLMAPILIEALSADPVSPALKSGVKRKPTSPIFKQTNKAEEEDKYVGQRRRKRRRKEEEDKQRRRK